jgi:hypothetical protein
MRLQASGSSEHAIAVGLSKAYGDLFSRFQTRAEVGKLGVAAVALLFQAASKAHFYTQDAEFVRDMQLDLNALRAKGRASQAQYIELNDALIGSRMFSEARVLERAHPGAAVEVFHSPRGDVSRRVTMTPVPEFRDYARRETGPTDMTLTDNGGQLIRRTVNVRTPAQIIVVISPSCHFANAGLRDIEGDPQLRKAFHDHTIWLVPPFTPEFDAIAQWNGTHTDEKMTLAYRFQEWSMLDSWATPTFYFLRRGTVVAKVAGWPRQGRKPEIRNALKQIGLL